MTKQRRLTRAEIDAQLDAARKRTAKERAAGRRAASATYNARAHRLDLTMTSGVVIGIPVDRIPYLVNATSAQLRHVTVSPTGAGVSWEQLDVDLSLDGLLIDALGRSPLARALGRVGGATTSHAKAVAARANGKKGGRPRKYAA
jgi:hypothetical protein